MIDGLFDDVARNHASAIAIVDGETRLTYGELALRRDQIVSFLSSSGIGPGDRIGVSLPNSWEFAAAFLAAARIGADWVPFHTPWKSREIERLAGLLPLHMLITTRDLAQVWHTVHKAPDRIVLVDDLAALLGSNGGAPSGPSGRDPSVYYTTSGSTGHSRIVPRRHSQIAQGVKDAARALDLRHGMRWLAVVPFHHGHGLNTLMLQPLTTGGTMVVMHAFNPASIQETISRERIQVLSGSPFHYAVLADHGARPESFVSVEICLSGGAPMAPALTRRCREQLGLRVRQYYGASETGAVAFASDDDAGREDGVMWPVPGMEVRIADEDGLPVGPGVIGRVEIRGPGIFKGYLGEDDLNAKVLRDGFYLTGDLGRMDERGRLRLSGRVSAVINVSGTKVDPLEVENVIRELPQVQDCCVRGFPDERLGEIIEALIVIRPGAELRRQDLVMHCRQSMAEHKIPRRIKIVDSIPTDAAGKRKPRT